MVLGLGDDTSITSTSFGKVADGIEAKIIDELWK